MSHIVYVLTHEYFDKSSFSICGVTESCDVAQAWMAGGDDNYAYVASLCGPVKDWQDGLGRLLPEPKSEAAK